MPFTKRNKSSNKGGKMYNQEQYDGAMSKITVPQARRKMANHLGMSQVEYNKHMAGYKPVAPIDAGTKVKGKSSAKDRSSTNKKK